jgi:hypothetical protein
VYGAHNSERPRHRFTYQILLSKKHNALNATTSILKLLLTPDSGIPFRQHSLYTSPTDTDHKLGGAMNVPADIEVRDEYRIFADPTSKTLNDNITNTTFPLGAGRHLDGASHNLGDLDKFPAELQIIVLVQLDLKTLTNLRHVNRRAMEVVDTLPELAQYQSILKHSPASLRAILDVGLGESITCQKLYDTLCTANCEGCRQPAEFIYLLKCCRVCLKCLCWRIKFCPITTYDAARLYALPERLLAGLPTVRSVPGQYGAVNRFWPDRYELVDCWLAYLVAKKHWAEELAARRFDPHEVPLPSIWEPYTVPFRYYPEALRFMAVVRAPLIQDQERKRR